MLQQIEMDKLNRMRIFVVLADSRNFSDAARRLGLAASTVSRAITALETSLEARLVERTGHTVALTATGERYVVRCRHILECIEQATFELKRLEGRS